VLVHRPRDRPWQDTRRREGRPPVVASASVPQSSSWISSLFPAKVISSEAADNYHNVCLGSLWPEVSSQVGKHHCHVTTIRAGGQKTGDREAVSQLMNTDPRNTRTKKPLVSKEASIERPSLLAFPYIIEEGKPG
jgi:hypothetical protein